MEKISVLAPIGASPPVITEFVQYVEEVLNERISDLTVILTSHPYVKSCTDLVEQAVLTKYPHIHFHRHELKFEDLDSEEKVYEFMVEMTMLLRDEVVKHKADRIYINATGGRKDSLIALSVLSSLFPVKGVFHVLMPDIQTFNIELERIRNEIEEIGKTENKREFYLKHWDIFDRIMYPSLHMYSVVKIPLIPFPLKQLKKLSQLLSSSKTRRTGLDEEYLERLKNLEIVHFDRTYVYPTEEGLLISKIIKIVLE